MEIILYIYPDFLHIEIIPDDKRKAEIKHYENNEEGLNQFRNDVQRIVSEEAAKIHILHNEVYKPIVKDA